jgi:hypothetical protein
MAKNIKAIKKGPAAPFPRSMPARLGAGVRAPGQGSRAVSGPQKAAGVHGGR